MNDVDKRLIISSLPVIIAILCETAVSIFGILRTDNLHIMTSNYILSIIFLILFVMLFVIIWFIPKMTYIKENNRLTRDMKTVLIFAFAILLFNAIVLKYCSGRSWLLWRA
jgi:hypothetical protein